MKTAETLDFARPLASVDLAIFAVLEESLQVLLVQRAAGGGGEPYPRSWALPGGFVDVDRDRDLEGCAQRKLREKAGIDAPYLEQVGSWGSADRDPRGWSATHVYFALLGGEAHRPLAGGNAADARWFAIDGLRVREKLAFDHAEILKASIQRLRNKVEYTSLPAFLMPAEFTLSELQKGYEITLGRPLEKKAFRTRILAAELLEEVPRQREGANRPAQLYRLAHRGRLVYFARALVGPKD